MPCFDYFSEVRVPYQYYVVDTLNDVRASQKLCFSSILGAIFTLEFFFFAHVTFVVLSNSIKQTASKSANNFSSYKGTYRHTYTHTYITVLLRVIRCHDSYFLFFYWNQKSNSLYIFQRIMLRNVE